MCGSRTPQFRAGWVPNGYNQLDERHDQGHGAGHHHPETNGHALFRLPHLTLKPCPGLLQIGPQHRLGLVESSLGRQGLGHTLGEGVDKGPSLPFVEARLVAKTTRGPQSIERNIHAIILSAPNAVATARLSLGDRSRSALRFQAHRRYGGHRLHRNRESRAPTLNAAPAAVEPWPLGHAGRRPGAKHTLNLSPIASMGLANQPMRGAAAIRNCSFARGWRTSWSPPEWCSTRQAGTLSAELIFGVGSVPWRANGYCARRSSGEENAMN